MEPKISIIVPVYNVEQYLERCVESLMSQSYKNIEILLINDGSTDNSGKLCDEIAKRDSRITVYHKENGGLSDARNYGVDKATADFVGFVDSDDYVDEDMYEVLLSNLLKYDAEISFCRLYDVYNDQVLKDESKNEPYLMTSEEAIKMVLEAKIFSVTAVNKLYKKSLFNQIRFEKGKIAEDAFLMVDLLSRCQKIAATEVHKYYYMHRENSITTQKFTPKFLNVIEAYEKNAKIVAEKYPNLQYQADTRICWAYFYVLDRLLKDEAYKDSALEAQLIQNLKKYKKFILGNSLFNNKRKLSFLLLLIHKNLYKIIIKRV
ncbi:glycosyltransferase family 2 protein [Granulicatella adiacens]|uniref:glycosyltransferase family 2 protein n=1 Tax=Granulicatella adiacens TaxID=46124 RepID=UPI0021A84754|nr:glycosyltransferase family 2 protein [Granulicatella adiacens]MCT2160841.1 glycosyltransferase [Granulicatella adiacens]